jgi:hypothetical protein
MDFSGAEATITFVGYDFYNDDRLVPVVRDKMVITKAAAAPEECKATVDCCGTPIGETHASTVMYDKFGTCPVSKCLTLTLLDGCGVVTARVAHSEDDAEQPDDDGAWGVGRAGKRGGSQTVSQAVMRSQTVPQTVSQRLVAVLAGDVNVDSTDLELWRCSQGT